MMVEKTQGYVNQQSTYAWVWPGVAQRAGQKLTGVSKDQCLDVLKNMQELLLEWRRHVWKRSR